MIQICYTYNILRTFSLIVWSIFVSIFSCIDIFDFFVEKIGYISDIYQWYISMIYIMPTLDHSARRFVLFQLTTDRHEASRGLFATLELLVSVIINQVYDNNIRQQCDIAPVAVLTYVIAKSRHTAGDAIWWTKLTHIYVYIIHLPMQTIRKYVEICSESFMKLAVIMAGLSTRTCRKEEE